MKNPPENNFPPWAKNLTLYEVNLRQYTQEGTIQKFREHLPRLKELGVGILWFMPIQAVGMKNRKGSLGSYYSIRNYCEIDTSYGTLDEFISLVKEIHSMGMYVILDWVANHTAWDHHWVEEHNDYYRKNEAGEVHPPFPDWADVIGLDYSNQEMRFEMIESMKFWLTQVRIDGFRCDMAHLVPTDFWEQARIELEKIRPAIFMLAETDQYDLLEKAFQSSYDWKVFHAMNEVAQRKIDVSQLKHTIDDQIAWFPEHAVLMRFISNHDENSWQGSEIERLNYYLEPLSVLYFTLPGIPLIYSGQEAGNYRRLQFFDKDAIEWKEDKMNKLYSKLSLLRKENPALLSGSPEAGFRWLDTGIEGNLLAFERGSGEHQVLVFLNLGYESVRFQLHTELPACKYKDLINDTLELTFGPSPCFELLSFDFRVYYC